MQRYKFKNIIKLMDKIKNIFEILTQFKIIYFELFYPSIIIEIKILNIINKF